MFSLNNLFPLLTILEFMTFFHIYINFYEIRLIPEKKHD